MWGRCDSSGPEQSALNVSSPAPRPLGRANEASGSRFWVVGGNFFGTQRASPRGVVQGHPGAIYLSCKIIYL
jgi:hypothetical protein